MTPSPLTSEAAMSKLCPSCGSPHWTVAHARHPDGEWQISRCANCKWPPSSPMSPLEWRQHPHNPLNDQPKGATLDSLQEPPAPEVVEGEGMRR